MKDELLFWYGPQMYYLKKSELAKILCSHMPKTSNRKYWYSCQLSQAFLDAYDLIITCLHELSCIQVYNDNILRLHFYRQDHFSKAESITILDSEFYNDVTSNLITDLVNFAKSDMIHKKADILIKMLEQEDANISRTVKYLDELISSIKDF